MKAFPIFFFVFGCFFLLLFFIDLVQWYHTGYADHLSYDSLRGVLLGFGFAYFIWMINKRGNAHNYICTSCFKVSFENQIQDNRCPHCKGEVEVLKGFYERHPEFRDRK